MKSLADFEKLVVGKVCVMCETDLTGRPIEFYMHPYGWSVEGFVEKQWLYVVCPNPKCGYQVALWKIGIPRE